MARNSGKQPIKTVINDVRSAVGYIRLSVANKDEPSSVETQKRIINHWVGEHAIPICYFYIDKNHSDSNFDHPAFKKVLKDIDTGRIEIFVLTTRLWCDILIL